MQVSEVFVQYPAGRRGDDDGRRGHGHRGKRRVHHHEYDHRARCWRDWDEWR